MTRFMMIAIASLATLAVGGAAIAATCCCGDACNGCALCSCCCN